MCNLVHLPKQNDQSTKPTKKNKQGRLLARTFGPAGGVNYNGRNRRQGMQLKSNCGVLWDMDGVLVDSGEFHFQAWVGALRREGIGYTRERFQATFGMDNRTLLTTLLGREPETEWLERVSGGKEA